MLADELCFAMIHIVLALSQLKINDIDGVYLAYGFIGFPISYIFRNCLGYAIEHSVEIGLFSAILHFDDAQLLIFAFCQDVYTVVFVFFVFLISLAFQETMNLEFLAN